MSERKPLTLEELREMHDSSERVGTRVLLRVYSVTGIEGILDCREDDGICAVYAASGEWLKEKDYGKTWLAYAYEPPRLNCEAWRAEWVEKTDDDGCVWFECSACEQGLDSMDEQHPFCPSCGRAMTDAAWDMLEKRLEK